MVSLLTWVRPASTVESMLKLDRDPVESILREETPPPHRLRTPCRRPVLRGAAGEAKTTIDQADAHCGDREQVGTDRHRADDEDLAVQDHAEARDHACREHEREIAGDRPGVARGQTEHVLPDQARLARLAARPAQDLHTHQRELRFRHAQPTQVTQELVDRPGVDSCQHDRVPRPRRPGERDAADVIVSSSIRATAVIIADSPKTSSLIIGGA